MKCGVESCNRLRLGAAGVFPAPIDLSAVVPLYGRLRGSGGCNCLLTRLRAMFHEDVVEHLGMVISRGASFRFARPNTASGIPSMPGSACVSARAAITVVLSGYDIAASIAEFRLAEPMSSTLA